MKLHILQILFFALLLNGCGENPSVDFTELNIQAEKIIAEEQTCNDCLSPNTGDPLDILRPNTQIDSCIESCQKLGVQIEKNFTEALSLKNSKGKQSEKAKLKKMEYYKNLTIIQGHGIRISQQANHKNILNNNMIAKIDHNGKFPNFPGDETFDTVLAATRVEKLVALEKQFAVIHKLNAQSIYK